MYKLFFSFETEIDKNSGFGLFGWYHILWLFLIAFSVVIIVKKYNRMREKNKNIIYKVIGCCLPITEIYRDIVLLLTRHFDRGFLPLHLCSMALVIGCLYCLFHFRLLGVIYILLCIPGAIGAVLFPDWSIYPAIHYMTFHSFVSHGLIIIFGALILTGDKIRLKYNDIISVSVVGMMGLLIVKQINHILGTNYWFANYPCIHTPLEIIYKYLGNNGYIIGFGVFGFVIISIWFFIVINIQKYLIEYTMRHSI